METLIIIALIVIAGLIGAAFGLARLFFWNEVNNFISNIVNKLFDKAGNKEMKNNYTMRLADRYPNLNKPGNKQQ